MNKKIIIIGSGASGVAAATKLLTNGFDDLIVLEAENRIGGRIKTVPFGENVVDMGAQWCHGQKGNVVYEMGKDKDVLEMSEKEFTFTFVQSNGDVVPKLLTDKLIQFGKSILEENAYKEEKNAYHGSLGNFFSDKFFKLFEGQENNEIYFETRRQAFEFFHNVTNSVEASESWYEVSCKYHEYDECDGDYSITWKDKGYVTVFDLLQNKIGESPENVVDVNRFIQFNKQVTKISYNQISPDQQKNIVHVDCSDGSSFDAQHIVCTIPLAVLKEQHLSLFNPLLPQWKYDSIEGMMMGTADKIFLEFEKPFWNDDFDIICLLWKREQIKEARDDVTNGKWLDGLMYFNAVKYQPNILCGWITGEKARFMEQVSDRNVKAGVEKVLRMFLKQTNIPDAKAMIRSNWYSNPNFRGSYTHYSLKGDALGASCEKLSELINDFNGQPIIQFAGEATSVKHFGNVHGAVESGWREAERLINLYKKVA